MPKTTFVRKPVCMDDVRSGMEKIRSWFGGDRTHYYVASEIELTREEWDSLTDNFFARREWIAEFSNQDHPSEYSVHACIRVTCRESHEALIIAPEGYDYARYVAIE